MRDTILFPKLNYLEIEYLEKLTTLWFRYYIKFPILKEFRIESCPQMDAFIFDDKVGVPSLQKMRISKMENLKMIWHNQLDGDSFSKLKSLEVDRCQKLLALFPSNICGRLLSLESLDVWRCGSLEEIFDLQGIISEERNSIASTQSRELCFSNLQELKVSRCQSLKYLFAASNNVANDEYSPKFLFPKLTSLRLWILPELRSFYPGRHTVEGPVLKRLDQYDCFIHDTDEEGQMQMQYLFCLVKQAFPCLEQLNLAGKNLMMMWQGQVPESLFVKLKILDVYFDDSTCLPLCIIQRFQNLEKLSIDTSSYKEIFSNGEDQTQAATPTRIKKLYLSQLDDVKYMWKPDFKLDLILQNLEALNIRWCNSLINVMPPSASFQNLTVMQVVDCRSLINIGTSSAVKSLVQLSEMTILLCKNIIEVVGNHGDVTDDEIIFPKLKRLSLRDLPSLTSFCSWKVTLQFPSLEELIVVKCPQMKIFSQGVLHTPTLWKVEIDDESIELCPNVDINKTIQQFHENVNAKNMLWLQKDNELEKAEQQLDEETNVQSSIKDCEGSSSHHLEIKGDPV
ncbi:hypothetical protein LWI28_001922 [Acer negundo]|uniref:Disease resistance protein At4g27190-like leucine-rich repeats domain-containing protein n=1 Tax=Acer negundo TaxID=4023 RepID=A0AAD5J791_ACENE|nr:hypothetical protein LWI28_001922 [Acer negundo]